MRQTRQKELEEAFEVDRMAQLARWNGRIFLACVFCLMSLYPADGFLPTLPFGVQTVYMVRTAMIAMCCVLAYLCTKPILRDRPGFTSALLIVCSCGLAIGGLAAVTGGSVSLYRENNLGSIAMIGFIMPYRPRDYIVGALSAVACVGILFYVAGTVAPVGEFINHLVLLGLLSGLATIAVYIKDNLNRKVFISNALLEDANEELSGDLNQARVFQRKLLPVLPSNDGIKFAAHYEPATFLGGDFYEITERSKDWYRVFLTDVTGHGTQAAMRTMILHEQFLSLSPACDTPDGLLLQINNAVINAFGAMEINYCAMCLDLQRKGNEWVLTGANAGLPAPAIVQGGKSVAAEVSGTYQGVLLDPPYPTFQKRLQPGDGVFIATDGLVDLLEQGSLTWQSTSGQISAGMGKSADELLASVLHKLPARDAENRRSDDVTAIAICT